MISLSVFHCPYKNICEIFDKTSATCKTGGSYCGKFRSLSGDSQ